MGVLVVLRCKQANFAFRTLANGERIPRTAALKDLLALASITCRFWLTSLPLSL